MTRDIDERHMRRCLELAARAQGRTSPNPMVGCVIVDPRGEVVAEGFHRGPGKLHAEPDALSRLTGDARGHTLYCNLEPCNHKRKRRTWPCAPQILEAGITRLVIGAGDPIRSHAGGARWLERHGVEITRNVLRAECVALNRAFFTWAKRGRPLVVLKTAMTLDGKIATRTGQSQWITGERARKHGRGLRDKLDAILVGIGTVLADDPQLTVRNVRGGRDPVRIVVDSRLKTPPTARVLPANTHSPARVIIATTERAARTRQRRLEQAGAEVWCMPTDDNGRVSLTELCLALGRDSITSVLIEGGAHVHGSAIAEGLADELMLYVAPRVVGGGALSPCWVDNAGVDTLEQTHGFKFDPHVESLGRDLLIRAYRDR